MTQHSPAKIAAMAIVLCNAGCSNRSRSLDQHILDRVPTSVAPLHVDFDGNFEIRGYYQEPSSPVKSGQQVELDLYWLAKGFADEHCLNITTTLFDGAGRYLLTLDNEKIGPLRKSVSHCGNLGFERMHMPALGPSDWMPGKVYVDETSFALPGNLKPGRVQVGVSITWGSRSLGPRPTSPKSILPGVGWTVEP